MEKFTTDTRIIDVINHPSFAGCGDLLFAGITSRNAGSRTFNDLASKFVEDTPEFLVDTANGMLDMAEENRLFFYDIYSEAEKQSDAAKSKTGLFFFKGKQGMPFAILNAGGAFRVVASMQEAFPYALELAERGYNAFVLRYSTVKGDTYDEMVTPPSRDLARALRFVFDNKESLEVSTEDYSLWGASAGAGVVSKFVDTLIASQDDTIPEPSAVILEYCGYNNAIAGFPPVFGIIGDCDSIISCDGMIDRFNRLKELGVETELKVFEGMDHCFGAGRGTPAEGWVSDAIAFWEKHINT